MTAVSCKWVKQRLNSDLRHARVLVRVQVYSLRWNCIRPPTALQPSSTPPLSPLSLMYLLPLGVLSISQRTWRCQEVRDLQNEERTMFLEMSLCFMAYRAAIKHLVGSWSIKPPSPFFSSSSSSHSLRGQIPSRCCLPICVFLAKRMNQNHTKCPKCTWIRMMVCIAHLVQRLESQ